MVTFCLVFSWELSKVYFVGQIVKKNPSLQKIYLNLWRDRGLDSRPDNLTDLPFSSGLAHPSNLGTLLINFNHSIYSIGQAHLLNLGGWHINSRMKQGIFFIILFVFHFPKIIRRENLSWTMWPVTFCTLLQSTKKWIWLCVARQIFVCVAKYFSVVRKKLCVWQKQGVQFRVDATV